MATLIIYSEVELVSAIKHKEIPALEYLYDLYSGALYGYLINEYCKSKDTEGVLAEVFAFVWFEIEQYDPDKSRLFTWMLGHLREQCNHKLKLRRTSRISKISEVPVIHFYNKYVDKISQFI